MAGLGGGDLNNQLQIEGGTDATPIGNVGDAHKHTAAVSTTYVQGVVTVGATQVEAKVGANRLANRQSLTIYNKSNATVYVGPSGVTTAMRPLFKDQVYWTDDANLAVYMIAGAAGNDVVVEEKGN